MQSCFVIIGYGKKVSYANGKVRLLDLNETYTTLIEPAFKVLNISCYRAIDKNVNGSIDRLMLEEIKNADIALADISTLNANVMWELGVRHALKPRHTIMICEKEQMSSIPFDINHFVVHQYVHTEEGIPYKEVGRFVDYLVETIGKMLKENPPKDDSPVFAFLADELNIPSTKAAIVAQPAESFVSVMNKAEDAKNAKDFKTALNYLAVAKEMAAENMTLSDNITLITARQALCTYKLKEPNELESYVKAKIILDELNPAQTQDTEVLGLSGAICKRLFELTNNNKYLEDAIIFYEKGFQLKQDYYNGINAAFMLYIKAGLFKKQNDETWEDVKLKADYIRNSVLEITKALEAAKGFLESKNDIWVLLTIAEVYNYKKNEVKMKEYEEMAQSFADKTSQLFAMSSYYEQKEKIQNYIS